jgi:hypothetical protein
MRENDVELSGFVVLGKNYDRPVVHFELVERAPKGLRLEPASPISREGFARYVVTNASDRRFAPSDVLTQRRLMQDWVDVDDRHCVEPLSGSLRPGRSLTVTAESSSCLTEPLLEGHYRHVVRLTEIGAEDECVPELTRAIKLSREFGSESIGSFSTHAFADVPISELTAGGSVSAGDDFASTVYARDGGSACVCAGSYVGKERLRARQGMGDSICMTASELDASAFLCQPIKSYQKVGDFPFRRDQSTFPDEP